jgi:hypothetical protein
MMEYSCRSLSSNKTTALRKRALSAIADEYLLKWMSNGVVDVARRPREDVTNRVAPSC